MFELFEELLDIRPRKAAEGIKAESSIFSDAGTANLARVSTTHMTKDEVRLKGGRETLSLCRFGIRPATFASERRLPGS